MEETKFYVTTSKKNRLMNLILSSCLSLIFVLLLYSVPSILYVSILFFILYYLNFYRVFEYKLTHKIIGGYGSLICGRIMEGDQAKFYYNLNLLFIIIITIIGIYYQTRLW